jgi:hypothetical protein
MGVRGLVLGVFVQIVCNRVQYNYKTEMCSFSITSVGVT